MIVSICLPVKNGGLTFQKTLLKVLSQKTDFQFEVIIVDSGSKDGSVEFIRKLTSKHSNIKLIEISAKEFGHGKTRNFAIENSSGEFIVMITQDSLPYDESWLQKMIEPFSDTEVALVVGKHIPYKSALPVEKYQIINHFDKGFGTEVLEVKITDKNDYKNRQGWYIFSSDNNAAMRRSVWEKIKLQEVEMGEDQFWAKDILEAGYKKVYTPNAIVYHSHRYSFSQIIKRYYDEYKFHVSIGNIGKANRGNTLKFYLKSLKQSFRIVLISDLKVFQKPYYLMFYIFYDFARAYGYYLGTNADSKKDQKYSMQREIINS